MLEKGALAVTSHRRYRFALQIAMKTSIITVEGSRERVIERTEAELSGMAVAKDGFLFFITTVGSKDYIICVQIS